MAKAPKVAQKAAVQTFTTTEQNRARRLAKHLKAHPNDLQAARAPGTGSLRKKPKVKGSAPAPVVKIRNAVTGMLEHRGSIYGYVPEAPRKREEIQKEKQPFYDFMYRGVAVFGEKDLKPTEAQITGNVKALCFGLGIHYTGRRSTERRRHK